MWEDCDLRVSFKDLSASLKAWQAPMYQKHNTTVKASKKRKMACQQKKILRFFKNIILIFHIIFPCAQISADFFKF